MFINAPAGDYHLACGSPCIDSGTNMGQLLVADHDGLARPLDGNGNGSTAFDMGAFEFLLGAADSNGDGIPDGWCHQYGFSPADPNVANGNPDNDAHTTFQEWIADTNPTNANSYFHIDRIETALSGSSVKIYFEGSSNRIYTLHWATNLAQPDWRQVPGQADRAVCSGMDSLSDTNASPLKFYRVSVAVP